MTSTKGIDYGLGRTNIDTETDIRFGVIPQIAVLQAWADTSEPFYGELDEDEESDDFAEPLSFFVDDGEYKAESDDHGDVFIAKSPFYTYAQFCSPCAPGACYLMNPVEPDLNNKCYCFGHDWFDGDETPYSVYSVATGKEVPHE